MPASLEAKFKGLSWGLLNPQFGISCDELTAHSRLPKYARGKTRLGIPFLPIAETLHGLLSAGATIFPQTIAGGDMEPELVKEMASTIAKEGSAMGLGSVRPCWNSPAIHAGGA